MRAHAYTKMYMNECAYNVYILKSVTSNGNTRVASLAQSNEVTLCVIIEDISMQVVF